MKKKILCIFFLIFYLLIACTILSQKIETEMFVRTESFVREMNVHSTSEVTVSTRAIFTDEQGNHLYEIVEGTGWESGLRIQELPTNLWYVNNRGVISLQGGRDYTIVYSASRQPQSGERAVIIEEWEEVNDKYIVLFTQNVPALEELWLPENIEIAGQDDNVLLLDIKDTTQPFFEHKAKSISDIMSVRGCRIFSLTGVMQFLEEIPGVILVASLLVMSLILWIFSCCLSIRADKNKVFIFLNAGLMLVLLCFMQYVLNNVSFPAAMLPGENIFDLQHYQSEYTLIFSALEGFPTEAQSLIAVKEGMIEKCKEILYCSAFVTAGIVAVEGILAKVVRRR